MKTILRIVIILALAAAVAFGYFLVVNNAMASAGSDEGRSQPAMSDGTRSERPEGMPDRDEGGSSLARGTLQIGVTFAKLTGIVLVVLFLERGINLLFKKRASSPA